jgi:hypothetical protein
MFALKMRGKTVKLWYYIIPLQPLWKIACHSRQTRTSGATVVRLEHETCFVHTHSNSLGNVLHLLCGLTSIGNLKQYSRKNKTHCAMQPEHNLTNTCHRSSQSSTTCVFTCVFWIKHTFCSSFQVDTTPGSLPVAPVGACVNCTHPS